MGPQRQETVAADLPREPPAPPAPPTSPTPEKLTGRALRELTSFSLVLLVDGTFVCVWAAVVWGVTAVLGLIQPHMPPWAAPLFEYAEIGFALFILAKLFLKRADEFTAAFLRARQLLTAGRYRQRD
jgi:hypothetical protein